MGISEKTQCVPHPAEENQGNFRSVNVHYHLPPSFEGLADDVPTYSVPLQPFCYYFAPIWIHFKISEDLQSFNNC